MNLEVGVVVESKSGKKVASLVKRLNDIIAEALHKADKRKKTDVKPSVTGEKYKTVPT